MPELMENNVKVEVIGVIENYLKILEKLLVTLSSRQKIIQGLKLIFALNYGSKDEIISAVKTIASECKI